MLGIGCLVVSVVSACTARGLVRTARWAWPTALCVALTLVVAAVVLFVEGPWRSSHSLIAAVGLALALALLPASVRRAFGM